MVRSHHGPPLNQWVTYLACLRLTLVSGTLPEKARGVSAGLSGVTRRTRDNAVRVRCRLTHRRCRRRAHKRGVRRFGRGCAKTIGDARIGSHGNMLARRSVRRERSSSTRGRLVRTASKLRARDPSMRIRSVSGTHVPSLRAGSALWFCSSLARCPEVAEA